jgi:hypothetical protein
LNHALARPSAAARRSFAHFAGSAVMTPAQGIAKLGFRRWYERQLIEGHVWFVTCFLCMIVVAACLEQLDVSGPFLQFVWNAALVVAAAYVCFKSLRWYNFLLARAETLGAQSSCKECSTYGILKVVDAGHGGESSWIRVRCKKCGHEWRMDGA